MIGNWAGLPDSDAVNDCCKAALTYPTCMTTKVFPFDEMRSDAGPRGPYDYYDAWFAAQDNQRLAQKAAEAEAFFRRTGITFNVYGQTDAEERLIPFDLIPVSCPAGNGPGCRAG